MMRILAEHAMAAGTAEPKVERREFARANLYLPLLVRAPGEYGQGEEEHTVTVNVSCKGLYFISARRHTPGSALAILLTVPSPGYPHGPAAAFQARAEVVHAEPFMEGDSSTEAYGIGVKFPRGVRLEIPAVQMVSPRNSTGHLVHDGASP